MYPSMRNVDFAGYIEKTSPADKKNFHFLTYGLYKTMYPSLECRNVDFAGYFVKISTADEKNGYPTS
jgi:hypothetical protein